MSPFSTHFDNLLLLLFPALPLPLLQLDSMREDVGLMEVDLMALRKNVREAGWAIANAATEVEELTRTVDAAQAVADASGTGIHSILSYILSTLTLSHPRSKLAFILLHRRVLTHTCIRSCFVGILKCGNVLWHQRWGSVHLLAHCIPYMPLTRLYNQQVLNSGPSMCYEHMSY